MNWALAIEVQRRALLRLLRPIVSASGPVPGGVVETVTRAVRKRVLDFLLPAEAALRRLIVIAARGMTFTPRPSRGFPAGGIGGGQGCGDRAPVFWLVDPIRRVDPRAKHPKGDGPRVISFDEPFVAKDEAEPHQDDVMDATWLCRRLQALQAALDDVPAQARRLARWLARGEKLRQSGRWARVSPLRSGRPPGHRARNRHPVDEVLKDCHELALYSMANPEKSD